MRDTVLVTGAAGFIGSHCCRFLLESGWRVVGMDNFDPFYPRSIKESALEELSRRPGFRFVEGDIRKGSEIDSVMGGIACVLHFAARAGARPSIEQPDLYASVNINGTVGVLEACRRAGVTKVIFASSSSVYGNTTPVPFREDAAAGDPVSPYAATKRAGELFCRVYSELHGFRIAAVRLFTVYGPRQRPDLAIHRFTRRLFEGRPVEQFGDGSMERDHTHIEDILGGLGGALTWVTDGPAAFEVFNLGESQPVRLDRLIGLIAAALGVTPLIQRLPVPPADVHRTWADISRARQVLGYAPRIDIEDGIRDFVQWFKASQPA
jgi:UDP-glucuronate 4-epimerase